MKVYIKKILLVAVFGLSVFFSAIPEADAFIGLNIGFSSVSGYGYNYNPYFSYTPSYYDNSWYNSGLMPFYGNNYNYYGYQNYYNPGAYYNTGYYYDYNPIPNPGYYVSNRMYSNWYGY